MKDWALQLKRAWLAQVQGLNDRTVEKWILPICLGLVLIVLLANTVANKREVWSAICG